MHKNKDLALSHSILMIGKLLRRTSHVEAEFSQCCSSSARLREVVSRQQGAPELDQAATPGWVEG